MAASNYHTISVQRLLAMVVTHSFLNCYSLHTWRASKLYLVNNNIRTQAPKWHHIQIHVNPMPNMAHIRRHLTTYSLTCMMNSGKPIQQPYPLSRLSRQTPPVYIDNITVSILVRAMIRVTMSAVFE